MVATDITRVFLDITDAAGGAAELEEKMWPAAFQAVEVPGNKVYYLPWLAGIRGAAMTVNMDHTEAAGIDYLNFGTYEEVIEAGVAMTQTNDEGKVTHSGYSIRSSQYQLLWSLIWQLGGDFFDLIRLEQGRLGMAIADVSDKGIPAALFMMSSRTLLKGAALGSEDPGAVITVVNDQLQDGNEANMFVTLFYAVYDPQTGLVRFANGGHNPPLIVHRDGSSTILPLTGGVALGVAPEFEFGTDEARLEPGEALVMYTDGVSEAENLKSEEFGMDRLQEVFAGARLENARDANDAVFAAVREFAGERSQSDDITCLVLLRADA